MNGSPGTVTTLGFGTFGSVGLTLTLGLGIAELNVVFAPPTAIFETGLHTNILKSGTQTTVLQSDLRTNVLKGKR